MITIMIVIVILLINSIIIMKVINITTTNFSQDGAIMLRARYTRIGFPSGIIR